MAITQIPVSFDYKGKHHKGYLSPVSGAGREGGTHFYLNINGYHRGQLFLAHHSDTPWLPRDLSKPQQYKWRFTSQTGEFEDLVDFFVDVLIAWYE